MARERNASSNRAENAIFRMSMTSYGTTAGVLAEGEMGAGGVRMSGAKSGMNKWENTTSIARI